MVTMSRAWLAALLLDSIFSPASVVAVHAAKFDLQQELAARDQHRLLAPRSAQQPKPLAQAVLVSEGASSGVEVKTSVALRSGFQHKLANFLQSIPAPTDVAEFSLFGIQIQAWTVAMVVSCLGSALTVLGFILQKKGAQVPGDHLRIGDLVITRLWIAGFLLVVVADFPFTMFVYSLAPISLIAPLSGVTVVLNFCVAPLLLGEARHMWPDLPATLLIVAGIVLTTLVGGHDEPEYDSAMLWSRFNDPGFQCVMAATVVLIACCIGYMQRSTASLAESAKLGTWSIQHILLPALVAAGCGLFSNIHIKAAGIILASGAIVPALPWLFLAAVPACLQVNYLNRGMQLYPQAVFIPIYSACLMLATTIGGAVFYQDFSFMTAQSMLMFFGGAAGVASGISLFALRDDK